MSLFALFNLRNLLYFIPGDDPAVPPADGFEWRGQEPVGSDKGSWVNPQTGEQYHPDLNHGDPVGPHYDYTNGAKPRT